jgi:hypothetical protein
MKNNSWTVFLLLGMLILAFSLHNIITIPLFFEDDHWDWLTRDAAAIEYIRALFRIQGLWQMGFAALILVTAVGGYRRRQSWAWYALWIVPLLLIGMSLVMPWLIPILAILIILSTAALLGSRPMFFTEFRDSSWHESSS